MSFSSMRMLTFNWKFQFIVTGRKDAVGKLVELQKVIVHQLCRGVSWGALGARAPRGHQRGAKKKEKRKGKERERGEKRGKRKRRE